MAKRGRPHKVINPEDMTDEEIEAFNDAEKEKREQLKARQERNRAKDKEPTARDPGVLRGVKGDDCMEVVAVRKIGLDNEETCEIGETISLPKAVVIRLQDAGAVRIKL